MKRFTKIIALLLVAALLFAPMQVSAWGWLEKAADYADLAGGLAKAFLPEIAKKFQLDGNQYEALEKAIVTLLNSDWYKKPPPTKKLSWWQSFWK